MADVPKINPSCKAGVQAKAQPDSARVGARLRRGDLWWRVREAPVAWEQAGQHKVTHLPCGAHSTSRLRGDKASLLGTRWLLWKPFLCVLRAEPWRHPSTPVCPPCSPGCYRDPLSYGLHGCLTQCRPQRLGRLHL